jgi:hypothetical protein
VYQDTGAALNLSVRLGLLSFERVEAGSIRFNMPLEASDFIKVFTK